MACTVTNLAASVGGLTWMLWVNVSHIHLLQLANSMLQDYRIEKKWSAVGFCSGAIAGLVAITPASGFVGARKLLPMISFDPSGSDLLSSLSPAASVLFGVAAGTFCNFATQFKYVFEYDDTLDASRRSFIT